MHRDENVIEFRTPILFVVVVVVKNAEYRNTTFRYFLLTSPNLKSPFTLSKCLLTPPPPPPISSPNQYFSVLQVSVLAKARTHLNCVFWDSLLVQNIHSTEIRIFQVSILIFLVFPFFWRFQFLVFDYRCLYSLSK